MSKALLKKLEQYCAEHGVQATAPRRYMLEIIAQADLPLTAYGALDQLGQKLDKPNPPTAYRALDFLSKHGFIHRIESLNAYIACDADHNHRGSQFMICDGCTRVFEAHLCHLPPALEKQTADNGFHVSHWNVEIHGQCSECAGK